jgi:GDP-4-dehydro-6-deoxy-D-mannose reductase
MRALITGVAGFAGSHLADYLLAEQPSVTVAGTLRPKSRATNLKHIEGQLTLFETDLLDYASVLAALDQFRPDLIFHLAGQSFVPVSWSDPVHTLTTNVIGQTHLFEAIRSLGLEPRIQIACSSEEYGLVHADEVPILETNPLRPLSPYAVSKVAQDFLAYQYFQSYGLQTIRTRAFNHTGPRRGEGFVASNFAKQLAVIEAGQAKPLLRVGNLEAIRDFTDVRDVTRGYWLAATEGTPGEVYNIASDEGTRIGDLLHMLLEMVAAEVRIERDAQRLRPSDIEILIGDSTKFRRRTGWSPAIPLRSTLGDLLDFWRRRIAERQQQDEQL